VKLSALTTERLRHWRDALASRAEAENPRW
jgi:hypothetical protein